VTDTLAFPDVGVTQKLWVDLNVSNSDVSKVVVELYGPGMSTPYLLYNGGKTGSAVVAKYNDGDALVSGDMNKDWLGKNIKGNWSITVKDTAAITVPPGTPAFVYDGKFNWSISIQTLSSKKVQIKGNLIVDNDVTINGNLTVKGASPAFLAPTLRYKVFSTYEQSWNWFDGNDTRFFAGINPSNISDGNAVAWSFSADKALWRTLFNQKMEIAPNMHVWAEETYSYSSTNGRHLVVLFRIKNTTGSAITWQPHFSYSSYGGWNEYTSLTLNGAGTWSTGGSCYAGSCTAAPSMAIPANRTSSVIMLVGSGPQNSGSLRGLWLAFYNNSLALPAGLEFVDDLNSATGGWEK
jgi:hypothetical protein